MGKHSFWQKPTDTNFEVGHDNRKVSWLELFFDIFFVCAIAVVGHLLAKDIAIETFKSFTLTFVPIWWIWIGFTFYNERFETFGIENRVFTFLMMIPVAGLAIFAHHATSSTLIPFAVSYMLARLILAFLYGRAAYYLPAFKKTGAIYVVCFLLSILVLATSVFFLPLQYASYTFGLVLLFDLLIPFIAAFADGTFKTEDSLILSPKVDERFGLFVIIVIGELVVAVINGISELEHPITKDLLVGIGGLAIGFGMWWIYFDFVGRRGADKTTIPSFIWSYLHMPLVMCFIALSAGMLNSIEHPGHLDHNTRILISFAAGIGIVLIGLIETVSFKHKDEPMGKLSILLKLITGLAIIIIGYYSHLDAPELILVVFVCQAINMIYGVVSWFKMPEHSEYESEYTG